MRNFDEEFEQDLSFTVGGESFEMRYVRPEILAAWDDEAESGSEDEKDDTNENALKIIDDRILLFLSTEEDRGRWTTLRAREKNAVPLSMVNEILKWMVEVQTARPTNPPLPLASGRGRTEPSSKAA